MIPISALQWSSAWGYTASMKVNVPNTEIILLTPIYPSSAVTYKEIYTERNIRNF